MEESKLMQDDKDEWFFQSMNKYQSLYMFEMEFPLEALTIVNDKSLCLAGMQAFSKKCEILQLCIPPKLVAVEGEEGLVKNRDFEIISGGYANGRILQVKPISSASSNLVAAVQQDIPGVTLFQLGDEEHAIIKERAALTIPHEFSKCTSGHGVIDTNGSRIISGGSCGQYLYIWNVDNETASPPPIQIQLKSPDTVHSSPSASVITKIKFLNEETVAYCTSSGHVNVCDLRSPGSSNIVLTVEASQATKAGVAISEGMEMEGSSSSTEIMFSFDTVFGKHKLGVVDTCGGYESFDIRQGQQVMKRSILPGFGDVSEALKGRFNVEYEPSRDSSTRSESVPHDHFIVSGFKTDCVPIFTDFVDTSVVVDTPGISHIFEHDGHGKTVSHAMWHPVTDRLVFSASVDSILHAWQFTK